MDIKEIIAQIKNTLLEIFSEIDEWFLKDEKLLDYKPKNGGWNITQIQEHIGLTNHFLLILIEKGTRKALAAKHNIDLDEVLQNYTFHFEKLNEVGLHKSFTWIRPTHMEPKGERNVSEVRDQLKAQLKLCLETLEKLPNGEGVLSKTTMSVNDLGKIDVYEYIYFLAQHGKRHLTQMRKIEHEFIQGSGGN